MGIDRKLHVWPARRTRRKPGDLKRLAAGLLGAQLVTPPYMLVIGTIDASPSFWLHDIVLIDGAYREVPLEIHGVDQTSQRVAYVGDSTPGLLAAIDADPPSPDACVVFGGLDFRNRKLARVLEKRRHYSGTVSLRSACTES